MVAGRPLEFYVHMAQDAPGALVACMAHSQHVEHVTLETVSGHSFVKSHIGRSVWYEWEELCCLR